MKKEKQKLQLTGKDTQGENLSNYSITKDSKTVTFGKYLILLTIMIFSITVNGQSNWVGTTNSNWFSANNWSGGVPTINSSVNIPSGAANMPIISAVGAVCKSISINNGASLVMNSNGELNVSGNWSNNGSFLAESGKVTFSGTLAQGLSGSTTFNNLTINNSEGVSLDNDITVKTALEFDSGNIVTGTNTLTLDTNAVAANNGGFVEGNLKQYVPTGTGITAWFIVGTENHFTPVELYFYNVIQDGYITVKAINEDHQMIGRSILNDTLTLNRHWKVTNSGVTFDQYSAEMQYSSGDMDNMVSDSLLNLSIYSDDSWTMVPNGSYTSDYFYATGLTTIGDMQVGQIGSIQNDYSISPVYGSEGQTLDIQIYGIGFLSAIPTFDFGPDILINNAIVNSDSIMTVNITILPTATQGTRSFTITPTVSGTSYSSILNFTVISPLPIVDFSSSSSIINYCTEETTTFSNLSSNATGYFWNFGEGASPSIAYGAGPYSVSYSSPGLKTMRLTASNGIASETLVRTAYVTVNGTTPTAPATLFGPSQVCSLLGTDVLYSCTGVSNSSGYDWTVPSGTTLISGQGSTSISIHYPQTGFTTGIISVSAKNACGAGAYTDIIPSVVLPNPGTISGPNSLCGMSTAVYTVSSVAGTTSYQWTVPTGLNITSGQGSNTLHVSVASGSVNGNISISATNPACISSTNSSLLVNKKPAAPGPISGPTSVCGTSSATYSIAPVYNATSYSWTLPSGMTAVGNSHATSINVSITSSYAFGQVKVAAVNTCGNVPGTSLKVYGKPVMPVSLTGPLNVCGASTASYSCSASSGATSYSWVVPTGMTITNSPNGMSINVAITGNVSGVLKVRANSPCASSAYKSINITTTATAPGAISGPTNICGLTSATYSVTPVTGAVSYDWVLPPGVTGTSITNSIFVNIAPSVTSTGIKVATINGCGVASAQIQTNINRVVTAGTITGNAAPCTGSTATYTLNRQTGITYSWSAIGGTNSSQILTSTTSSVNVSWNGTTGSGSVKVNATNACGTGPAKTLPVNIISCINPEEIIANTNEEKIPEIKLYPNPTTDEFNLDINSNLDQEMVIEVIDVLGKKIMGKIINVNIGTTSVKTNVEEPIKGMYFVRVIDKGNNTRYTNRLIKQ